MAQAEVLARLQKETKCPICLDDLTNPVTIECGHNFCHSCIKDYWADQQVGFSCPVCQCHCQHRGLRSKGQLGKMIETAQLLQGIENKMQEDKRQESRTSCEKHNQALTLFCEDDLQLLCDQCIEPESHGSHQVRSITEAASLHRKHLKGYTKVLKWQVDEVQELMSTQRRTTQALREQAEAQRLQITSEFEKLTRFLDQEERAALSRLEEEETRVEKRLLDNTASLEHYGSMLRNHLSQLMLTRELSEAKMLAKIKDFYLNCNTQFISPFLFQVQLGRQDYNFPLQYSALQKVIQHFTVKVTLDLKTVHPNLLISEDRTCVTFTKERQRMPGSSSFTKIPVVLGIPHFNSGRHFWRCR